MKYFFYFLLFVSSIIRAQEPKKQKLDTVKIIKKTVDDEKLKKIDSLWVDYKFSSSLVDTLAYVINDKDIIGETKTVLTTDLLKQRLKLLGQKTPFNLAYNPILEKTINTYLVRRQKYYPTIMARAAYFFPMFEEYLDRFDIPLEMKYLAIVESALLPTIKSRAGATGLWQFMYGTGKQYNLEVNSYVDERQDPVKSTIAACKYLNDLYDLFGDWDLALAAYNSGPGNVTKAIKRSGGYKNYWNIRAFLPRETADYVPAFYATLYIFEYAKEHNIYPEIPEVFRFETDTIKIKRTVTFDQIAKVLEIDQETLTNLNPSYKLDIIPFVENKEYALRLPKSKVIEFLDKEQTLYELANQEDATKEKPILKNLEDDNRIVYKVKSGDYLGKIAAMYGVGVSEIKRWNRLKSTKINIGQKLYIFPRRRPS